MGRNIFTDVLPVNRNHPDLTVRAAGVIDDAQGATFALTLQTLPKFSHTTGAGNNGTTLWMHVEELLKLTIFVIVEVVW